MTEQTTAKYYMTPIGFDLWLEMVLDHDDTEEPTHGPCEIECKDRSSDSDPCEYWADMITAIWNQ